MSVLGPPAVTLKLMNALAGQGGPLAGQESASAALRAPGRRVANKAAVTTAITIRTSGPKRHATARKDIRAAKVNGSPRRNVTPGPRGGVGRASPGHDFVSHAARRGVSPKGRRAR